MEPLVYSYLEPVRQDAIAKFDANASVQDIIEAACKIQGVMRRLVDAGEINLPNMKV